MLKKEINLKKLSQGRQDLDLYRQHLDYLKSRHYGVTEAELQASQAHYNELVKKYTELEDETLRPAIKAAEGKARARTIVPWDITGALQDIEKTLGLTKKAMEGVQVLVDVNAQTFAKSYWRHSYKLPDSTHFRAIYKAGSWRVTDIFRDTCASPKNAIHIEHTEASKQALIDKYTWMER